MLHSKAFKFAVLAAVSLLEVGTTRPATARGYNLTPLPAPPGFVDFSFALGVNDAGQVVGESQYGTVCCYPVIWNGGVPSALETPLRGQVGAAAAVNNRGEIAGWTGPRQPDVSVTVWNGGVPSVVGPLTGGGEVTGINDAGQVVGWDQFGAVTWKGGAAIQLGAPPGEYSGEATGINKNGQIVGRSYPAIGSSATLWNEGVPSALGTLPGWIDSQAFDINDAGEIVGAASTTSSGSDGHAILWSGGNITDLGTLGGTPYMGGSSSAADAINDAGQIVGWSFASRTDKYGNPVQDAVIWNGSTITDLNTILTSTGLGWTLINATGINDLGQIVGYGYDPLGGSEGFLLTPVPELPTWALMLLGFAGLGCAGYSRSNERRLGRRRKSA